MPNFFKNLLPFAQAGEPFALGIITGVKGSSPQKLGAKAAFLLDGRIAGTVGGGCLEAEVQDRARRALQTGLPAAFDLVLDHLFGWDDGLVCGGSVSVLILPNAQKFEGIWRRLAEPQDALTWGIRDDFSVDWASGSQSSWRYQETVSPPDPLWIAGSGHLAQAVAPLAQLVDFAITVLDDRPALANSSHFPSDTIFRVDYWEKLLEEPMPVLPTYGLIVTRGHQHDALVLRSWIHRPFVFLGMIGSRRKARVIRDEFVAQKIIGASEWDRVICPVGLEIKSQTVNEIAVSIVAQLIAKRAERKHEKVERDLIRPDLGGGGGISV
jgi:xanthine dehydrogenase accessory factor